MTLALAALRELELVLERMPREPSLPAIPACLKQANDRAEHDAPIPRPPTDVLEALRRELQRGCAEGGPATLHPRTLRQAPLVFWNGKPPAASFAGLVENYIAFAVARPRWLLQLIEAWLRDFDPEQPALRESGLAIAKLLAEAQHPRIRPWHDAAIKYQIFDATNGPRRVGLALLYGPDEPGEILACIGMHDPLRANGDFFRATIRSLLAELPAALRSHNADALWSRAEALLQTTTTKRDRSGRSMPATGLRFGDMAVETARACLAPWLSPPPPAGAPRKRIESFLVRNLGDPRVNPRRWTNAAKEAGLMRRWLAEASLEAFLALISQSNDDAQWHYRQAFWRACLRAAPAAEVWVVLGPDLSARAASVRDLQGSFGTLAGSGTQKHQAVLLMRMGDLVLSEWSNIGPVRAWSIKDRSCPELYRTDSYMVDELRAPSLDFPDHPKHRKGGSYGGKGLYHNNGQSGRWQGCAAALLSNRLGLRLQPEDYMPR